MTWLEEVATHLAANGYGTLGTTITAGHFPATPDNLVNVSDRSSYRMPEWCMGRKDHDNLRLDVRVRHVSYATGDAQIFGIYNLLDMKAELTLSGTRYVGVRAELGAPASLGKDENARYNWLCTFHLMRVAP